MPIENIEIIQNTIKFKNNILDLELDLLFKEYANKNIAIILIEESSKNEENIFKNQGYKIKLFQKILI